MQPLSSIHVRTEALALTKLEVWWYLLMRLGPQLPAHFEQVVHSHVTITGTYYESLSSLLVYLYVCICSMMCSVLSLKVCVPLIQSTLGLDASLLQGNSSRLAANQSLTTPGSAQKSGMRSLYFNDF